MLITEVSTETNETHANVTGLQTGMSLKLYVAGIVSISQQYGNFIIKGKSSDPLLVSTSIQYYIKGKYYLHVVAQHVCSSQLVYS